MKDESFEGHYVTIFTSENRAYADSQITIHNICFWFCFYFAFLLLAPEILEGFHVGILGIVEKVRQLLKNLHNVATWKLQCQKKPQ